MNLSTQYHRFLGFTKDSGELTMQNFFAIAILSCVENLWKFYAHHSEKRIAYIKRAGENNDKVRHFI